MAAASPEGGIPTRSPAEPNSSYATKTAVSRLRMSPKRAADFPPAMAPAPKRGSLHNAVRILDDLSHKELKQLAALLNARIDEVSSPPKQTNGAKVTNGHAPHGHTNGGYAQQGRVKDDVLQVNAQSDYAQEFYGQQDYAPVGYEPVPDTGSPSSVCVGVNKGAESRASDVRVPVASGSPGNKYWSSPGMPPDSAGHALQEKQTMGYGFGKDHGVAQNGAAIDPYASTPHHQAPNLPPRPTLVEDNSETASLIPGEGNRLNGAAQVREGQQFIATANAHAPMNGHHEQNGMVLTPPQVNSPALIPPSTRPTDTRKSTKYASIEVTDEYARRCKLEGVSGKGRIWLLEDTSFVGRFLLATMNHNLSSLPPGELESWRQGHHVQSATKITNLRNMVKSHVTGLVKRCGGLAPIIARKDACSDFLAAADHSFQFDDAEKASMPVGHWFSDTHSFVLFKTQGFHHHSSRLWTHPDPGIIGQYLLQCAEREMKKLRTDNAQLQNAGGRPTQCYGNYFGLQAVEQVVRLRQQVLSNCAQLALRRGGLDPLMGTDDAARGYVVLAMDTFFVEENEMREVCRPGAAPPPMVHPVDAVEGQPPVGMAAVPAHASAPMASVPASMLPLSAAAPRLTISAPGSIEVLASGRKPTSPKKASKPRKPPTIAEIGARKLKGLQKHLSEQSKRRARFEAAGKQAPAGSFIDKNLRLMNAVDVEGFRRRAISDCWNLASQCGGMGALRQRPDACGKFVQLVVELFRVSEEELSPNAHAGAGAMGAPPSPPATPAAPVAVAQAHDPYATMAPPVSKAPPAPASKLEPTVARPNGASQTKKKAPAPAPQRLEMTEDPRVIGKQFLDQIVHERAVQEERRVEYQIRNGNRKIPDDAVFSANLVRLSREAVETRRRRVLETCRDLVARCGGMNKALMRADECTQFINICVTDFKIKADESGLWMQ